MVVSKSGRHTYAERVIDAFSQLQRERKKHAIHIASLRAQVRKNARERRDELGPQWSSWVGKAVHRLEDEGVLVATEPHGTIALTPSGKRAIQNARRNFIAGHHTSPSPAEEDSLWKHVTQQIAGRGLKRKQATRGRPSGVGTTDDDDEEEEEVLSTLKKRNTRNKRPRLSAATKKPLSKMTKAEIKAELEALQKIHAQADRRPGSEEVKRLQHELRLRQEEIDTLHTELANARRVTASEQSDVDEDALSQLTTPESTPDPATAVTPIRPYRPNIATRSQPLNVMRTVSGSLISELSKQPTPAPSSPDREHENMSTHEFAAGPLPPPSREAELEEEVEKFKRLAEEAKKINEDVQEKIARLENELDARSLEVENLKKTLSQVQSDRAEKELSLSQRIADMTAELDTLRHAEAEKSSAVALKDARILQLQAEKVSIDASLAFKDARLVEVEQVVHEHEASIAELRAEKILSSNLRASLHDLDLAVKEHMNIFGVQADSADTDFRYNESAHGKVAAHVAAVISELKRNGEETIAKQATVAESLGQVKVRLNAVIEEMQGESGISSATMQAGLGATSRSAAGIGLDVQDLYAHVGALEPLVRSFREQLKSSKTAMAERDAELTKTTERVHALSSDLQLKGKAIAALEEWKMQSMKITSERDQLRGDLERVKETRARLAEELLASNTTRDRLTIEMSDRQREVHDLRSMLDDAETKTKHLELTLKSAQEEQTAARNEFSSTIDSLNATLASTQRDVERLKSDLHAAHVEVQSLQSRLTERLAERSHLQEMLEAEKIHVAELRKQHEDVLVKMQEAEEDIAELRKSKEADEATIETLKKGFTKLRNAQMQSLAELENGVVSANASPVAKGRHSSRMSVRV